MKNATNPAERHLNLVIALMNAVKPLTRRDIQASVAGYDPSAEPSAFERMFERDKETLRLLGLPLVTVEGPLNHPEELGYRIEKEQYELDELVLDPAEVGVLSLATKLWQDTALEGESERGLTKLKSNVLSVDAHSLVGFSPRIGKDSPALEPLLDATTSRRRVSFHYRSTENGEYVQRTIEPWSLLARGTGWYVVGLDVDKGEQRIFKLARIKDQVKKVGPVNAFEVPQDKDFSSILVSDTQHSYTAQLALRTGQANELRVRAQSSNFAVPEGYEPVEVTYRDTVDFVDLVAGLGSQVLVLEPASLRDTVISRLTAAAQLGVASPDAIGTATKEN